MSQRQLQERIDAQERRIARLEATIAELHGLIRQALSGGEIETADVMTRSRSMDRAIQAAMRGK